MYLEDKLKKAIASFSNEDILNDEKIKIELDYEDLIDITNALKRVSLEEEKLFEAYEDYCKKPLIFRVK